ncbi:MAG: HdeD family acid-resistance protein [Caldilineaceae bacterium]
MNDKQEKSFTDSLKQESLDTAKQLAPWRAGLPWWVVLVEGIVMSVIGILILIDPRKTTINVALFLAAVLVISGIIQLWAVLRGKAPERVDSLISARGSIAVFAGSAILLLFFLDYLGLEAGLVVFGLGSLIFGLTGFFVALQASGTRRRSGLIEGVFFTLFGILLIYVLFAGGEQVQQATRIVGWTAILGGLVLIGLSFYNRARDADREEMSANVDDALVAASVAKQKPEATAGDGANQDEATARDTSTPDEEAAQKPTLPQGGPENAA